MADILNFDVQKDNILQDVTNGNPYYINIQGSVNICHIRCGQKIEACNDVNFASMTNYGKILVLNPQSGTNSKCKIQLAFDSSNTNINDDGGADYKFQKAFFTVPSLHRLNDKIHDMETFLIFSSTQKNGNVLYIILCVLNDGTGSIPQGNTLLNYRLLDSLFTQNNKVPDTFGTSAINGIPNPVDISNFIPPEGMRNFYDYTHPLNTKVNFRVFQNNMLISNSTLDILKSKLVPGDIYTNFKTYIGNSLNPKSGLFFYFSRDLTAEYNSYSRNNKNVEKFDNDELDILNTKIVLNETTETSNKVNIKKLDIEVNDLDIEVNDLDKDDDSDKKKESFESDSGSINKNKSITFAIFIVTFNYIIYYFLFYQFLTKLFGEGFEVSDDKKKEYISFLSNNFTNNIIQSIISIRLKYTILNSLNILFIILIIALLFIYIKNDSTKLFSLIKFFGICILVIIIFQFWYMVRYTFNRFKLSYNDEFLNIENTLIKTISKDWYKIIKNIYNIYKEDLIIFTTDSISNDNKSIDQIKQNMVDNQINTKNEFSNPIPLNIPELEIKELNNPVIIQTGGDNGIKPHVPAPRINKDSLKEVKDKAELADLKLFPNFFEIFSKNIIREKFKQDESLSYKYYLMVFFMIIVFMLICGLQLNFITFTDDTNFKNIISFMCVIAVYVPLIIIFIVMTYYITDETWIKRLNLIIGYIGIFISLFISTGIVSDSTKNIPFWLVFCLMLIMSFVNIGCLFFKKYKPLEDSDLIGGVTEKPPEVIYKSEALSYVEKLHKEIELLEAMIVLHKSMPNNGNPNKQRYIKSLGHMQELINQISESEELKGNIIYREKFIDLLQKLKNTGAIQNNINNLQNLKSKSNNALTKLGQLEEKFKSSVESILSELIKE